MSNGGLPVRSRLAAWYTLVLVGVLLIFGAVVYYEVRESLTNSLDDDLRGRSDLLVNLVTFDGGRNPTLTLPTDDRRFAGSFQRLLDSSGRVIVDNSAVFGEVPVLDRTLREARQDRREWSDVDRVGDDARLLTTVIRGDGDRDDVAGYLQVGESRAGIDRTLQTVLIVLGIAVPVAAVASSLIGWWLSARALHPVNEISRRAREIAAGDLKSRLNLTLPDDEVGRLARTFDDMIGRLDEMWTRQRRFTADASHELRTPLAALRGQVEVALSQPRDQEDYREVLEALDRQLLRMTRLVDGLLLVARAESGAIPLEVETVDVGELAQSVVEQLAPAAAAKSLALRVEDGTPASLQADEGLLLQLLLNLTENAIHYTEQGEVVLSWRAVGGVTQISVRDTGPGIAPEHRERIFEPFYRIDAARSNGAGAGLGLAICQWIVLAHGGSLTVTSSEGGSTFTASIP